ncbi:MAG: type I secretion C-terminal target domain-containing protein [Pseudomonadota bacterium]
MVAGDPRIVPVGQVTVSPEFTSGVRFPQLVELQAVPTSAINGVDQGNFVLGPAADASFVFGSEVAAFNSIVGVYLIDPDGTISDPKVVFAETDQATPGDTVRLSDLYASSDLAEGGQFGLFLVANGAKLNPNLQNSELVFLNENGQPANINDSQPPLLFDVPTGDQINGNIFHTADADPNDGLVNPLNVGGNTQALSGLEPGASGINVGFEDLVLFGNSDRDFNDAVLEVDLTPTLELNFGFTPVVSPQLEIRDTDGSQLQRATVEVLQGSGSDSLVITASLDGTGVRAVEDGSNGLVVLEGVAPITTYQEIIRSVILQAAGDLGERRIGIQVEDTAGATSDRAVVEVDFNTSSLIVGTNQPDLLLGDDARNPIVGLGADDGLFGFGANDLLDGGTGDDFLDGGPGNDLLFGGPGIDRLFGGEGADQFFLLSLPDRGDQLLDFNADEGDVLNLSALFDGQANQGNVDQFLQFENANTDVAVNADIDGPAPAFDFVQVVTLVDPTGVTTVQEAVSSGSVVV